MSGIILAPNEISDLSRSMRPAAEEGTPAWGTAADVLGKGFKRFSVEPDTVALWDFTRKVGNPLADLSPEGNDLTLSGDVTRIGAREFGYVYDFPGTDDYLDAGNDSSLQITGELTVEIICRLDAISADYPISKWDSGDSNKSWLLGWDGTNIEFIISNDGSTDDAIAQVDDSAAPAATVLYLAGVFKPSTYLRLFVNGCLVAEDTSSIPASLYNCNESVILGGYMSTGTLTGDFAGEIAMARIAPRAKSTEEIWRSGGRLW